MRLSISMSIFQKIDILEIISTVTFVYSVSFNVFSGDFFTVCMDIERIIFFFLISIDWKRHYKQMLLLMRCKIIKLPVLKFRAKRLKTSINKEQRFPAASNFNEFDAMTGNIFLRSLEYICISKQYYFNFRHLRIH
jgi:hypothetical protein